MNYTDPNGEGPISANACRAKVKLEEKLLIGEIEIFRERIEKFGKEFESIQAALEAEEKKECPDQKQIKALNKRRLRAWKKFTRAIDKRMDAEKNLKDFLSKKRSKLKFCDVLEWAPTP